MHLRTGWNALALIAVLVGAAAPAAAGTAQIGHGDRNGIFPLLADNNSPSDNSAFVMVLLPDELVTLPSGSILDSLDLDKLDDATTGPGAGSLEIYLANTSETYADSTITLGAHKAGATLVYSSTSEKIPATIGWTSLGAFNGTPFTYSGGGLKIIFVWSGETLPVATRSYNRAYLAFAARPQGITTAGVRSNSPVADTATLNEGPSKPNLRFHYTPPASPWLVVTSGFDPLLDGAAYSNPFAFAVGATTPESFTVTNAGGAAADLSAGVVISNEVDVDASCTLQPPASLGAGASATFTLQHSPVDLGTASYTTTLGPFDFSQQGNVASAPQANRIKVTMEQAGRTAGFGFGPSPHDQVIGTTEDFHYVVLNAGTEAFDVESFTFGDAAGITTTCDLAAPVTVQPQTDVRISCHDLVTAAGNQNSTVTVLTSTSSGYIQYIRTGVSATEAPPAGTPVLRVNYAEGDMTSAQVQDGDTRHPVPSDEITIDLINTGDGDLVIDDLAFVCTTCTVVYEGAAPTFPITLAEGDATYVRFHIDFAGDTAAVQLHIDSNDAATPFDLILDYSTLGTPALQVAARVDAIIPIEGGTVDIPVANGGDAVLTMTATIPDDDSGQVSIDSSPTSLAPAASGTIALNIHPGFNSSGVVFVVHISSNDPSKLEIDIPVEVDFDGSATDDDTNTAGCCSSSRSAPGGAVALALVTLAAMLRRRRPS